MQGELFDETVCFPLLQEGGFVQSRYARLYQQGCFSGKYSLYYLIFLTIGSGPSIRLSGGLFLVLVTDEMP